MLALACNAGVLQGREEPRPGLRRRAQAWCLRNCRVPGLRPPRLSPPRLTGCARRRAIENAPRGPLRMLHRAIL